MGFLSNTDDSENLQVQYAGRAYVLSPKSVALVDVKSKKLLFSTGAAVDPANSDPVEVGHVTSSSWQVFSESIGYGAKTKTSDALLEQLSLTESDYDYLWYKTPVQTAVATTDVKIDTKGGTIAYPFVDAGQLSILSVAMGLSNGGVVPSSVKGVGAVSVKGTALKGNWTHAWVLQGEAHQIFTNTGSSSVQWSNYGHAQSPSPLLWLKTVFDFPLHDR